MIPALVVAVIATSNLWFPNITGSALTDPTLLSLAAGTLIAFHVWASDRGYIGAPFALIVMLAMTFLPGVLYAAPHAYGQSKVLGLAMTLLIVVVMTQIASRWDIGPTFLRAQAVFGVAVAGTLLTISETTTFAGRASVFGLNPIGLGRMAALAAVICILVAFWQGGWWRVLLVVAGAVAAVAAFTTGSRGPLIAAGMAILLSMLVARRRMPFVARILGVGGLLGGMYLLLNSGWVDSGSRIFSRDSSGRDTLWAESLELISTRPLGLGIGGLYGHITLSSAAEGTGYTQYSHNLFLEAAVEGGWVALVGLVLVLLFSLRWMLRDSTTPAGAVLFAIWTFAFLNSMTSSDLVGNRLLWVMIAISFGNEIRRIRTARTPEGSAGGTLSPSSHQRAPHPTPRCPSPP